MSQRCYLLRVEVFSHLTILLQGYLHRLDWHWRNILLILHLNILFEALESYEDNRNVVK